MNNKIKAETWEIIQLMFEKFNYNDHQLHFQATFDGRLKDEILLEAIKLSTSSLPLIEYCYVEDEQFPYWKKGCFSNKEYLEIRTATTNNLNGCCAQSITYKTDAQKGPQIHATLIKGKSNDAICISINHQLCDATGFQQYIIELSKIYSELLKNKDYIPKCNNKPRGLSNILDQYTSNEINNIIQHSSPNTVANDKVGFKFEGSSHPFIVVHNLGINKLKEIKNIALPVNATVNDVLYTAFFRALYRTFPKEIITTIPCPIDLRKHYLKPNVITGICNLNSFITCQIKSSLLENFTETLVKVKTAMDTQKKSNIALKGIAKMEHIFQTINYNDAYKIISQSFNNPLISLTNIGIIDHSKLCFSGTQIIDTFITGSIKYAPYFQIGVTTFHEKITLTVNLYGTKRDKIKIRKFLTLMEQELS